MIVTLRNATTEHEVAINPDRVMFVLPTDQLTCRIYFTPDYAITVKGDLQRITGALNGET